LGEKVAGVGREIVGEDDVVGGVGRFIPAQLGNGGAGRDGFVFPFPLKADELAGPCVRGGFRSIGAGLDGGREGDGDGAEGICGIDRNNLDARPKIRTIHEEVITCLGIIADFGRKIGRQIDHDGGERARGVGVDRAERTEGDAVVDLSVAGRRGAGGVGKSGADLDRRGLADGDGHLAVEMFLDQTGGRGGGIDLLILMHHPEHHHDGRSHHAQHGQTDGQTDQNFDQGERAAQTGSRTSGTGLAMDADHGVARVTVTDWV